VWGEQNRAPVVMGFITNMNPKRMASLLDSGLRDWGPDGGSNQIDRALRANRVGRR
jgi:hypothetical protein